MNSVTSKEACEIAATKLGLSYTSAVSESVATRGRPHGCIYASDYWLPWVENMGGSLLHWNDHPLHWMNHYDHPCGTEEFDCLCTSGRASIFHFFDVANLITQIACSIICRLMVYILDRMSRY